MRIIHVTTGFLGYGLSHKEHMLAREQVKAGHEVTILAVQIAGSSWLDTIRFLDATKDHRKNLQKSEEEIDGFRVIRTRSLFHYADLYFCRHVASLVRRFEPDMWHIHEPAHGFPAQVAQAIQRRQPVIMDQHQYVASFSGKAIVELEYRLVRQHVVTSAYRRADAVVSVTKGGVDFLVRRHHVQPEKITLIPLAVRTDIFRPDERPREKVRSELGLPGDRYIVLTTGSLQSFKHHEDLIRAVAKARSSVPNITLVIIGKGEKAYIQALKKIAQELAIEENIRWLPFVPEEKLAAYFNAADVATWPLFPTISISQAIACGLPLVLSTHPSQSHFLDLGAGLGFAPRDWSAMAAQFERLAQDRNLGQQLRQHNIALGRGQLSTKATAERYGTVYQQAMSAWARANQ